MNLEVIRFSSGTDSTNGILLEVDKYAPSPHEEGYRCKREFLAYTLEDEYRNEKVMGMNGVKKFFTENPQEFLSLQNELTA